MSIFPFILQEAEALMKLLVSERDAFSNRIYLSLVNLWERASLIQNVWGEKLDFNSVKKKTQIKYVTKLY